MQCQPRFSFADGLCFLDTDRDKKPDYEVSMIHRYTVMIIIIIVNSYDNNITRHYARLPAYTLH